MDNRGVRKLFFISAIITILIVASFVIFFIDSRSKTVEGLGQTCDVSCVISRLSLGLITGEVQMNPFEERIQLSPVEEIGVDGPDVEQGEINQIMFTETNSRTWNNANPTLPSCQIKLITPSRTRYDDCYFNGGPIGAGSQTGKTWVWQGREYEIGNYNWEIVAPGISGIHGQKGTFRIIPMTSVPSSPVKGIYRNGCVDADKGILRWRGGEKDGQEITRVGVNDPENLISNKVSEANIKAYADKIKSSGLNSAFFIFNNIRPGDNDGLDSDPFDDFNDVWNNKRKYAALNNQRMEFWNRIFTYFGEQGILMQIAYKNDAGFPTPVSDSWFDRSAYNDNIDKRFQYHLCYWNNNPGEEYDKNSGYSKTQAYTDLTDDAIAINSYGRNLFPPETSAHFQGNGFDTNIAYVNDPASNYKVTTSTSIQNHGEKSLSVYNTPGVPNDIYDMYNIVRKVDSAATLKGKRLVLGVDETWRFESVDSSLLKTNRNKVLYPVTFAQKGLGLSVSFNQHYKANWGGKSGPLNPLSDMDSVLSELGHARKFMENLPGGMTSDNSLIKDSSTNNFCKQTGSSARGCYALKHNSVYSAYFTHGGTYTFDLTGDSGNSFDAYWYNPRTGVETKSSSNPLGRISGGNWINVRTPTNDDWLLKFVRVQTSPTPIPLTATGDPKIGGQMTFNLNHLPSAGLDYILAMSWTNNTGIEIGTKKLSLDYDNLLETTLRWPTVAGLENSQGTLDAMGRGTVTFNIKNINELNGIEVHVAFLTIDPKQPQNNIPFISPEISFRFKV